MSSSCRCAGATIAKPTAVVMKPRGGKMLASIRPSLPVHCGWRPIRWRQFRLQKTSMDHPARRVSMPFRETAGGIRTSAKGARIAKRTQLSRLTLNRLPSNSSRRTVVMPVKARVRSPKKANSAHAAMRSAMGSPRETVIGALEDAEDYKAFEAAIIADYDARSAVERELVLRLASLLWRLRRAATIERAYSKFRRIIWSSSRAKFATLRGCLRPVRTG